MNDLVFWEGKNTPAKAELWPELVEIPSLLDFTRATHPAYQVGWFQEVLAKRLSQFYQDILAGSRPRLILNTPPRHGKSTLASERFPAWVLGQSPAFQVISASYNAKLAGLFSRRVRNVIEHPYFRKTFPDCQLSRQSRSAHQWETTAGGIYHACGVRGGITGMGANLLLLDDPIKGMAQAQSRNQREAIWEWFEADAMTRLLPSAGVAIICTRWHEDDLVGRLVQRESERWQVIRYPALAVKNEKYRRKGEALDPVRYPQELLDEIRLSQSWLWETLYQQNPIAPGGALIRREWWRFYEPTQRPASFEQILQSWDLSFEGGRDFVVGQVWGKVGAKTYLLHQVRGQWDFTGTLGAFRALHQLFPEASPKLVEAKANGPALIQTLQSEIPGILPVQPRGSKMARVMAISPYLEAGNIFLPLQSSFTWELVQECTGFPRGAFDDQVDAMTQALLRLYGSGAELVWA